MLLWSGNAKPLLKFSVWWSRWADNRSPEFHELHEREDEGLALCAAGSRHLVDDEWMNEQIQARSEDSQKKKGKWEILEEKLTSLNRNAERKGYVKDFQVQRLVTFWVYCRTGCQVIYSERPFQTLPPPTTRLLRLLGNNTKTYPRLSMSIYQISGLSLVKDIFFFNHSANFIVFIIFTCSLAITYLLCEINWVTWSVF